MSSRSSVALAAALFALAASPARADLNQAYQSWMMVVAQGPIAGRLWTQSDVQYRAFPDFSPAAILVRPGLAFKVAEGMLVTVGYAWTPSWRSPGGVGFTEEHRAWLQFTYDYLHRGSGVRLQSRTRLEQRFRPSESVEYGARLREFVRFSVPLLGGARPLIVVAWDEVFLALNRAGGEPTGAGGATAQWQSPAFDQNRAFVGVGYQVVPGTLRLELGYLNQFVRRPTNPAGDLMNHEVLLASFVSWP